MNVAWYQIGVTNALLWEAEVAVPTWPVWALML